MGRSTDYSNVPEWKFKPEGYDPIRDKREILVRYQGNVFKAKYWAGQAPGIDAGWGFEDELYDLTPHVPTGQAKIIAYLPAWKKDSFDYAKDEIYRYITHAIIAFLMFDEKNLGKFTSQSSNDVNAMIKNVVNTGHRNGVKVMVALGGATDYGFLHLMTAVGNNPGTPLLNQAVQEVVRFVQSNNLDGVDLDLECWWDANGDPRNDQGGRTEPHPAGYGLTAFAKKLRAAMPGKLISAAFFASSWYGNNYQLIDYVDWIGVMTYDLTGSWNNSPVGPHSALYKIRDQKVYGAEQQGSWPLPNPTSTSSDPIRDNPIQSVEEALWYWTNPVYTNWQGAGQRMPRSKFVGGVPLYGYDFAYKKDPDALSGQVPPGYKTITYKDILAQFSGASTAANGNIKVPGSTPRPLFTSASGSYPYAHNIYFETPATAVAKLNFLKDVGAQGVIIWELTTDVWEEGKSIVKALYENSGNGRKEPLSSKLVFQRQALRTSDQALVSSFSARILSFTKGAVKELAKEAALGKASEILLDGIFGKNEADLSQESIEKIGELVANKVDAAFLAKAKDQLDGLISTWKEYASNSGSGVAASTLSDLRKTAIELVNQFDFGSGGWATVQSYELAASLHIAILSGIYNFDKDNKNKNAHKKNVQSIINATKQYIETMQNLGKKFEEEYVPNNFKPLEQKRLSENPEIENIDFELWQWCFQGPGEREYRSKETFTHRDTDLKNMLKEKCEEGRQGIIYETQFAVFGEEANNIMNEWRETLQLWEKVKP